MSQLGLGALTGINWEQRSMWEAQIIKKFLDQPKRYDGVDF